jgi:DNA-binding transcriptional MerR regulator
MDFETSPDSRIPKDAGLERAMEKLRRSLRVAPESHLETVPVPTTATLAATGVAKGNDVAQSPASSTSAEELYSRLVAGGRVFKGYRVDDSALLGRQHSLAQLRLNLEECRTVLSYLQTGPLRAGLAGQMKNSVTRLTWRVLNWFITPSITFDRSAANALNECAVSLDLLTRQVQVIARELASLSEAMAAIEASQGELGKRIDKN